MAKRVILTAPAWHLSGVNTMTMLLASALHEDDGYDVEILLTHSDESARAARDTGGKIRITTLSVDADASFPVRWQALRAYLAANAPCIYFPSYDFENSGICTALPKNVATIGVLHSDEPHYFEMTKRVGSSWNRIVGVSQFLADEVMKQFPQWGDRTRHIPYGVVTATEKFVPRNSATPLRIIMAGRISRYQKRIQDLSRVADELAKSGVPAEITVVGGGPDEDEIKEMCHTHIEAGRVRFAGSVPIAETVRLYQDHDIILMLSEFEGLPLVLLEAMAAGCVPVTSAIRSGIPELVIEGETGFQFPIGDTAACAKILKRLATDNETITRLSARAHEHIMQGPYRVSKMVSSYIAEIDAAYEEASNDSCPGRDGKVRPPPQLSTANRIRTRLSSTMRAVLGLNRR